MLADFKAGKCKALTSTGRLLDIYPTQDRMVCWIKEKDNVRLEDSWTPPIYAAADDRADFKAILNNATFMQFVKDHGFVSRRTR